MWHCVWGTKDSVLNGWYVYLKDANKLDAVQYDPFSNKVNLEGVWPTGVKCLKYMKIGGFLEDVSLIL